MSLAAWVDVHHHGPLEVGYGAGYCVHQVIMRERTAVAGDAGELVEEGAVAVLGSHVLPEEALTDHEAVLGEQWLQCVDDADLFLALGPFALLDGGAALGPDLGEGGLEGSDPHALAEVGLDLDQVDAVAASVSGDLDHCPGRVKDLVADLEQVHDDVEAPS